MPSAKRKFSIVTAAFFTLTGAAAVGCLEATGEAEPAGPVEAENAAESQQSLDLDLSCDPTAIGADRTFSTAPGNCLSNTATSIGDIYGELFCTPYVVEYTYKPSKLSVDWDHNPWSKDECEAMRARLTAYTFAGGAWANNGTAKLHGVWCEPSGGGFCPERCAAVLDAGSSLPAVGAGTKWRASATAFAQNCGGSSCYTDYKRVAVSDAGSCVIP